MTSDDDDDDDDDDKDQNDTTAVGGFKRKQIRCVDKSGKRKEDMKKVSKPHLKKQPMPNTIAYANQPNN